MSDRLDRLRLVLGDLADEPAIIASRTPPLDYPEAHPPLAVWAAAAHALADRLHRTEGELAATRAVAHNGDRALVDVLRRSLPLHSYIADDIDWHAADRERRARGGRKAHKIDPVAQAIAEEVAGNPAIAPAELRTRLRDKGITPPAPDALRKRLARLKTARNFSGHS